MVDFHRIIIATGIFFLMPLVTSLLLITSIIAINGGDSSAFIGAAAATFFLIVDAVAMFNYIKDSKKFLEMDIRARVYRDAFAPIAISFIFLFFAVINLMAGGKEVVFIFLIIFLSLLTTGIVFYFQKRRISGP